jgi:hypothetical protein
LDPGAVEPGTGTAELLLVVFGGVVFPRTGLDETGAPDVEVEFPLPTLSPLLGGLLEGMPEGMELFKLARFSRSILSFSRVLTEAAGASLSIFTCARLTNNPCKGSASKYRTSPTEPSFFPSGTSNFTPIHSPAENCVAPINLISPFLVYPAPVNTRVPTDKSDEPDGLVDMDNYV